MLHAMNTLSMAHMVEPMLWLFVLLQYLRFQPRRSLLPFRLYLVAQLAASALSIPALFFFESVGGPASGWVFGACTQIHWWGAILAGIFAIATLRTILKELLTSVPGLQRVFLIAFQWMLVAAVFVILERMISEAGHATMIRELAALADGLSMMQLLLLLPLLPVTFMARQSLRAHFKDVMMGLGVLAASTAVLGVPHSANGGFAGGVPALCSQVILLATQVFWIAAFVGQQQQEHPRVISVDAKFMDWGEEPKSLDRA